LHPNGEFLSRPRKRVVAANPEGDPFREASGRVLRERMHLLGGLFEFESNSRRLLGLVKAAYAGLPTHRLRSSVPQFHIRLQLASGRDFTTAREPPLMRMQAGPGLLCGVMDAANFAVLLPTERRGLVVASRELLRFPYHARYELLEFAVFVLAGRGQGLVSLHAACVGLNGKGLLLIGATGTGKSTIAVQCLLRGLEFLTEDAAFVLPEGMLATGVPNFLHLREDSLRFLDRSSMASLVRRSPVIRRRSGAEKFEVDLRRTGYRLAPSPLEICGVVFVSKRGAGRGPVLATLQRSEMLARLDRSQRYAAIQPGWITFRQQLSAMNAFELRRSRHPVQAADALLKALQ
jgi:hypothetical protein